MNEIALSSRVRLLGSSLQLPADLTLEEWAAVGPVLGGITDCVQWAIGDWLNYGETRFGEAYAQFAELREWKPQTLLNWKYVSHAYPPDERQSLSFGHHATVAKFQSEERSEWLEKAEAQKWTVEEFREAVHGETKLGQTFT